MRADTAGLPSYFRQRGTALCWLLIVMLFPVSLAQSLPTTREILTSMVNAEIYQQVVGEAQEYIVFPPQETSQRGVSSFSQPVLLTPALMANNYQPTLSIGREIAGRSSYRLDLNPTHEIRPRWTFWLDRETGVRLAYEQRSAAGVVLASGEYLAVERIAPRISPRQIGLPQLSVMQQRVLARFFEGVPLPPGFVPIGLEPSQVNNQTVVRIRLWDGLNGVVVIIYPRRLANPPQNQYVRSQMLRASTISVLSTLPSESVDDWLLQVQQSRLGQLHGLAMRQLFRTLRNAR